MKFARRAAPTHPELGSTHCYISDYTLAGMVARHEVKPRWECGADFWMFLWFGGSKASLVLVGCYPAQVVTMRFGYREPVQDFAGGRILFLGGRQTGEKPIH